MAITLRQSQFKEAIINQAYKLGFSACGFARVASVSKESSAQYNKWIAQGKHGEIEYMERYCDIRENPALLHDNATTMICVALNYYPKIFQNPDAPQFAYYAYGRDYHKVIKTKLKQLAQYIETECGAKSRACVDTAPLRERYWAQQAGIGFVGRNNQLILPGKGSFFFLGELITTLDIEPDEPCTLSCGNCNRCIEACPTGALNTMAAVDANKCISAITIEHHSDIPQSIKPHLGNRVYGCDTCQSVCPHNRHAQPTAIEEFTPSPAFLSLTRKSIAEMTQAQFDTTFHQSPIKRATLATLQRTLK